MSMKKKSIIKPHFSVGIFFLLILLLSSHLKVSAGIPGKEIPWRNMTWGIELGSSLDMSGHDLSTIDFDMVTGFRNRAIETLGIGTGIHRALGSRNTFIPIYFLCRTSFVPRPTLCFMHFKAGYNFNTINKSPVFGGLNASLGLGFHLSSSRNFTSHIIVAYGFRHFNSKDKNPLEVDNVSLAQLSFGLNF